MSMSMPKQKPGRSKQTYDTPPEFLAAVKAHFGIKGFVCDLAADAMNATADSWIDKAMDSLSPDTVWPDTGHSDFNWLNPPFANIAPWVEKANLMSRAAQSRDAACRTLVLVPASIGANWWADWVHEKAIVHALNGHITFVGEKQPYPKDCVLLEYGTPQLDFAPDYVIWPWKDDIPKETS